MIRHGAHVTAVVCLLLTLVSCGRYTRPEPALEVSSRPRLGGVLTCTTGSESCESEGQSRQVLGTVLFCVPWTESCENCAGVIRTQQTTPDLEDISVIIHVMLATMDDERRQQEYSDERAWAFAPTRDALTTGAMMEVVPGEPPVWVEYWTPSIVRTFFGRDGKVNEIAPGE